MQANIPSRSDINEQTQNLEKEFSEVNTVAQECMYLIEERNKGVINSGSVDENYQYIYLQNKMKSVNDTILELREKLDELKNVLLMDTFGETNYEELSNELLKKHAAEREFMQMFGGYIMLHQIMQTNNSN